MKKLGELLGGCLTFLLFFFFGIIFSTLVGALTGLVVGWFFSDTILGILASIGITGFKMWQIGAFLGFVGVFFNSKVTFNNNNPIQRNSKDKNNPSA